MLMLEKYKGNSFTLAAGVILCKGVKHNLVLLGEKVYHLSGSAYDVLVFLQDQEVMVEQYYEKIQQAFEKIGPEDTEFLDDFIESCIKRKIIQVNVS